MLRVFPAERDDSVQESLRPPEYPTTYGKVVRDEWILGPLLWLVVDRGH